MKKKGGEKPTQSQNLSGLKRNRGAMVPMVVGSPSGKITRGKSAQKRG